MELTLTDRDKGMLAGDEGSPIAMAMDITVRYGEIIGARHLIDIEGAHIDGCLYHGQSGLDFASRLAEGRARVKVPTTLNVTSLDLLHPELFRGSNEDARMSRALMDAYVSMGCAPTWTCAPYFLERRPSFGQHVAWAESNAIAFANSVLGARTNRYGDFIDICAALTGRAPAAGLHLDSMRLATVLIRIAGIPDSLFEVDAFYSALGHAVGRIAGTNVPVIDGLPNAITEDRLRALGAAAASSGGVALFHVVGVTPEAESLEQALGGRRPVHSVTVYPAALRAARDELSTVGGDDLQAVSVGTPHASARELVRVARLLDGRRLAVPFYMSTGRDVADAASDAIEELSAGGVTVVTDTCTYITPIIDDNVRVVMTNSGKWAYYAPGNLGIDVVFGSLEDCVESAVAGRVLRDDGVWSGG